MGGVTLAATDFSSATARSTAWMRSVPAATVTGPRRRDQKFGGSGRA